MTPEAIAGAYDVPVDVIATYVPVSHEWLEDQRLMAAALRRHAVDTWNSLVFGEAHPFPSAVALAEGIEHEWDRWIYDDDEGVDW